MIYFARVIFILAATSFPIFTLRAQEAKPDTYAGFNGQRISKVDIAIPPMMSPDKFRALILLKQGDTFSSVKLGESIRILQETRQFSKVQVDVKPDQSGL